jgi:hypothetical protein
MNWDALGAVAEILGAAGVIASLLYLSRQIRQNTRATRLAMSHSVSAAQRDFNRPFSEDPHLAHIFYIGAEDITRLDEAERTWFMVQSFIFFRMFEDMHYQFRHGSLDPDVWEAYTKTYGLYAKAPGLQAYWKARREIFQPAFRDFIEALQPPSLTRAIPLVKALEPRSEGGAS